MKKLIANALIVCCAISFIACSQDMLQNPTNPDTKMTEVNNKKTKGNGSIATTLSEPTLQWYKDQSKSCIDPGKNCFAPVIVYSSVANQRDILRTHIANNTVSNFFTTGSYSHIFPNGLHSGLLSDLQSGLVTVREATEDTASVLQYRIAYSAFPNEENCPEYD